MNMASVKGKKTRNEKKGRNSVLFVCCCFFFSSYRQYCSHVAAVCMPKSQQHQYYPTLSLEISIRSHTTIQKRTRQQIASPDNTRISLCPGARTGIRRRRTAHTQVEEYNAPTPLAMAATATVGPGTRGAARLTKNRASSSAAVVGA